MTWYICITCRATFNDNCKIKCEHSCPNGHTSVFDVEILESIIMSGKYYEPMRLIK